MTLFKDPTPRIERKNRQAYGVLVLVANEPGDDRVGYPAVVAFKGKNYGCYAFGDDLTAGDRVHFVEAGGQYWAIKSGSYYTTAYRKALKEWAAKSPATAALARIMKNNRKRYRYQAGTVVSTNGDTANVALVGETATRTFPVEFAGAPREIDAADVGKRCLVYIKENGAKAILPSSGIEDQIHDGDEADEETAWPAGDLEEQHIGDGEIICISQPGGGAITVLLKRPDDSCVFVSVQKYPYQERSVSLSSSQLPRLVLSYGPVPVYPPLFSTGGFIVWHSDSYFTVFNKETGTVTTFAPSMANFQVYAMWSTGDGGFSVFGRFPSANPSKNGYYFLSCTSSGVVSTSAPNTDFRNAKFANPPFYASSGPAVVVAAQIGVGGPYNYVFADASGTIRIDSSFLVDSEGKYQMQKMQSGAWFSPNCYGTYEDIAASLAASNAAGFAALSPSVPVIGINGTNFLRAISWRGKVFCPRRYYAPSSWYYRLPVYDPSTGSWELKTSSYVQSGTATGLHAVGTDGAFYSFAYKSSDPLKGWYVTRTKTLK